MSTAGRSPTAAASRSVFHGPFTVLSPSFTAFHSGSAAECNRLRRQRRRRLRLRPAQLHATDLRRLHRPSLRLQGRCALALPGVMASPASLQPPQSQHAVVRLRALSTGSCRNLLTVIDGWRPGPALLLSPAGRATRVRSLSNTCRAGTRSLKPFAAFLNGLGLRLGLWTWRGVHRKAAVHKLKVPPHTSPPLAFFDRLQPLQLLLSSR